MDIYELIKSDHQRLLHAFDAIEATPATELERRKGIFSYLRTELMVHAKPEEEVFYAEIRRNDLGAHLAEEAEDEHHTIERLVLDIQSSSARDEEWIGKLRTLRQVLETHMQREEGELFTLARQMFSASQAKGFAERMLAQKGRYGMENPVAVMGRKIEEILK